MSFIYLWGHYTIHGLGDEMGQSILRDTSLKRVCELVGKVHSTGALYLREDLDFIEEYEKQKHERMCYHYLRYRYGCF